MEGDGGTSLRQEFGMKPWMFMLALPLTMWMASCGISGGDDGPADPQKSELEVRNVSVTPTDSSATVRWSTTQQSVGTVAYGRSQNNLSTNVSSSLSGEHEVALAPLEQDTEYWLQITASSPLGPRATIQPVSFRTLVSPDIFDSTAPVISDIRVVGITPSSATITWSTDDRTRGTVFYGYGPSYGQSQAEPNPDTYVRAHSLTLSGLAEASDYHYRIQAVNRPGKTTFSADSTFRTAEPPYLEISPDTVHTAGNQDFSIRVNVRNASNIAGISFTLSYDPDFVEILSVREGGFWINNEGILFLMEREDDSEGLIQYAASWKIIFLDGTPVGTLANGGGEVAVINARTKGLGSGISPLRLIDTDEDGDGKADTRLFDYNRALMSFRVRNGWVFKQVK